MSNMSIDTASSLFKAVLNDNLHEVRSLLKHGADPNYILNEGISAFHVAVGKADVKYTSLFIRYGANVNVRSVDNWTPLHVAACWNKIDSLDLLLANGANPDLLNNDRQTPIQLAIEFNHRACIQALREYKIKKLNNRNQGQLFGSNNLDNDEGDNMIDSSCHRTLSSSSSTIVRSSTVDNNNTTSNWLVDNENTTFIKNKAENNEPNKTSLFNKQKLNETLLRAPQPDHAQSPATSSINVKDLEHMISSLIDKKLNIKDTDETKRPQHSTTPKHDLNTSATTRANIYIKFKNWFSKVNNNNSPHQVTATQPETTNCNNFGLNSLCLGSTLNQAQSEFSMNDVRTKPVEQPSTPVKMPLRPIDEFNKPITPIRKTPVKPKTVLFEDLAQQLKDIDKRTRDFIDEENKKFTQLANKQTPVNQWLKTTIQTDRNEKVHQVDDDVYVLETTLLTSDNSTVCNYEDPSNYYSAIYSWDQYDPDNLNKIRNELMDASVKTRDTTVAVSTDIKNLTNMELRREIESYGDKPGPITKTTRQLYEMRLHQFRLNGPKIEKLNNSFNAATKGFSCELIDALNGHVDFTDDSIEISMATCFLMNNENWREGHSKSCFNYMLIDPRVSDNLPARAKYLDPLEVFRIFIASIFYVGKGTRSRPYAHLFDALKKWKNSELTNKKLENVIACEAYTREACIIDTMGLQHLTNLKKGDYYGVANAWSMKRKCKLGVILLKKACDILIAEGERQLKPVDI